MRFQGFIGPSYKVRSVNVDAQRTINLFPEVNETGRGKENEQFSLVGTPGLTLLATVGTGPIRGLFSATNGTLYAVSANKVYSVSSTYVTAELGTINTSTGPVSMAGNGTTMVIVDGVDGWGVTLADDTFAQLTDVDFQPADQVTYQDGYFIFNKKNSGQFFISALNSATSYDALDIASSEGAPDNVVGLISDHRDLWLFNERTTEVFFNSGNADFPFERVQGAFIEHGCQAPFSIQKMNNTTFWLGQDDQGAGMVYAAKGYQPQRISTHAVEFAIRSYGDVSTARAWTYQEDGHDFYVINFPNADTSWVYDSSTNLWHERMYLNNGGFERHRAECHAFAYALHIVGDYVSGKIYSLSSDVFADNGDAILRRRQSPHISAGMDRVFFSELQLDMEVGVGLQTGQGSDPKVMLQFSDDGGHTWSNEKTGTIGAVGKYKARAIWRRLGASRDRIFRISISDPVKITLVGAELQLEKGSS